jgi:hypothetical protein
MRITKGSILEYRETLSGYAARGGARAEVTSDYNGSTTGYVNVHWLDEKANGQQDGGYNIDQFDIVEINTPIEDKLVSCRGKQNDNRVLKFGDAGKSIALFLSQLLKDPDFNIDEPMTDTYLSEVGSELGWSDAVTKDTIEKLLTLFE